MSQQSSSIRDQANRAAEGLQTAQEIATGATQKLGEHVKETAEQASDQAQHVGAQIADKAQQIGSQVVDKANAATTTVGEKLGDVVQTIRDRAPNSESVADAADTAADTLQRAGTYLREQDLNDVRSNLEGLIRRRPIASLLVGLGVGYLLARSMRR